MCSNNKIIIAIDGFSSCGKSTFAQRIAAELGYTFVDTGAMYRAVALFALRQGAISADGVLDENKLLGELSGLDIGFRFNPARGASDIYLNGECVEKEIRSPEVSRAVTSVSQVEAVRHKLVALQQAMGAHKGIVMDGRDIGTVVFPQAELKIFMTADPRVRAQRRYDELRAKGEEVSMEWVEQNIRQRDMADQQRKISPLKKADDAIVLDNSDMTIPEQMVWVMEKIKGVCVSR